VAARSLHRMKKWECFVPGCRFQPTYLSMLATEPTASRTTVAALGCEVRPCTAVEVVKDAKAWQTVSN
jgi:hypothetical protein